MNEVRAGALPPWTLSLCPDYDSVGRCPTRIKSGAECPGITLAWHLQRADELSPGVKTEDLERWPQAGAAFNIGIMVFRPKAKQFVGECPGPEIHF